MLVVISDLHLTDGSSGETINAGAFELFVDELADMAHDASWRRAAPKPVFKPIDRCDIVLLGDIFDVIRSTRWLESADVRPWSSSAAMGPLVSGITDGILDHNKESLKYLRDLNGSLRIPTDKAGEHVNVPLRIHYLVGNHDWFYHLRGADYDATRRRVVESLALANLAAEPFPHLISEASSELQELLLSHKLYVQHGDIYDPFNYEERFGRDHSSLGDCIVVELLNRFPHEVQKALGVGDDDPLIRALREIDNVRPLLAIPRWIDGVLHRQADPVTGRRVMDVWDAQTKNFLDIDFVRDHDRPFRWDTVDMLQVALRTSASLKVSALARFSEDFQRLSKGESLAKYAVAEDAIRTRNANYVVYGHTHNPETVPIDVIGIGERAVEQIYFNSGTWRRIHQPCIAHPKEQEFAKAHIMTYLAFYRDDERLGRRYESWTGQLG